jgi:hypothetical protein
VVLAAALILWTLSSPFVAAAALGRSDRALRAIGRFYVPALALGWGGLATLACGAIFLDGAFAVAAVLVGGPLAGLSLWSRRCDEDDDDDGGLEPPADEPPDDGGDGIDWDEFERAFRDYATRRPEPVPA